MLITAMQKSHTHVEGYQNLTWVKKMSGLLELQNYKHPGSWLQGHLCNTHFFNK